MKLQQLICLKAVAGNGLNISRAAQEIGASQPAVSKQLRGLERALGLALFRWESRRIAALSAAGEQVLRHAITALDAVEAIRGIGAVRPHEAATLSIATTHTHARYMLLPVLRDFLDRRPGLRLGLRQGSTERILAMVTEGEVDLGIGIQPQRCPPAVCALPCFRASHSVVFPVGHPLQKVRSITLEKLASFPIISLTRDAPHGARLQQRFRAAGLQPRFVFEALDSDVMKAYVEAGLGVAIIPKSAFSPRRDKALRSKDVSRLFEPVTTCAFVLRTRPLSPLVAEFLGAIAPHLGSAFRRPDGAAGMYPEELLSDALNLPGGPPA